MKRHIIFSAIACLATGSLASAQPAEADVTSSQNAADPHTVEYVVPSSLVRIQGLNPHNLKNSTRSFTTTRTQHGGVIGDTGSLEDLLKSGFVATQLCGTKNTGLTTAHCRENIVWYSRDSDDIEMRRSYCADSFDANCSWVAHIFDREVIEKGDTRTYKLTYRETESQRPGLIGRWPLPDYPVEEAIQGALNAGALVEFSFGEDKPYAELRTNLMERGSNIECNRSNWCTLMLDVGGTPTELGFKDTSRTSPFGITVWANFAPADLVSGNRVDLAAAYVSLENSLTGSGPFDLNTWRANLELGDKTRQGLIINRRGDLAEVQSCLQSRSIPGAPDQCIESTVNWMNVSDLVPE